MPLHLKAPLAIFDLETTGVNVSSDRIIEIAIIKMLPGGGEEKLDMRLNPEMPIPADSSMVHGIYDKDVKDQPTFADVAREIVKLSRFSKPSVIVSQENMAKIASPIC